MTAFNLGKTKAGRPISMAARFAARHGLIAGATGTGKSYTIARLVEQMTAAQVPCFLVDVKGDLSGIARSVPCAFLDPAGQTGARFSIRADDLGADSMARALELTPAQSGALDILYALAIDRGRRFGTIAEMTKAIGEMDASRAALGRRYGHFTAASLSVIRRALLRLERAPCPLFGQSTFDVASLIQPGKATILDAGRLYQSPALYGVAALHILQKLFDTMPEVGDAPLPKLALFLDEAHLIFGEMAPAMVQRIERIIRLIRSKGIAVFFASQSPSDIPPAILAQLGTRIQHGLRGATLADLRGIRAAAETMPINPAIDAAAAITGLGVGQALVSTIGADGVPTPVEIVAIAPPKASLAPIDAATRQAMTPAAREPETESRGDRAKALAHCLFLGAWIAPAVAAFAYLAFA